MTENNATKATNATKEELNEKYKDRGIGFQYALDDVQVSELEKDNMYPVREDKYITINNMDGCLPFGDKYFVWRDMKEQHLNGHGVIWHYDYLGVLSGKAGYVLVKGQFITGWNICTKMA